MSHNQILAPDRFRTFKFQRSALKEFDKVATGNEFDSKSTRD